MRNQLRNMFDVRLSVGLNVMDRMRQFGSLSLGSRLRRLSDRLVDDVNQLYQSQGIDLNPTFFPLFNLLCQQGAMTVTEAAEQLGVTHPAISKIARKMLAEGWLSKTADPSDERRQLLDLTPQSEHLLTRIEPVWHAIRSYLDQFMTEQQYPLLEALGEFEGRLERQGFLVPVQQMLQRQDHSQHIVIENWQPQWRGDFKRLNEAWLDKYFAGELTEQDQQALNNPEGYYLARGGYIFFARHAVDNRIVGCVALARHSDDLFEISKMGVDEEFQQAGVGRRLMQQVLDKARELGAREIYLESATCLTSAMVLYRNFGFRKVPHPQGQSVYPRSDIYMTLSLA